MRSNLGEVREQKKNKIVERQENTASLQTEREKYKSNREAFTEQSGQKKDLGGKIVGKKGEITGVEKQIEELQKNAVTEEDQEKLASLVQKKTNLEGELKALEARLSIVEKKIAELDKQEKEISAEMTRLESALGIIEGDIAALEEEEGKLIDEDTLLTGKLDSLSEIINSGEQKAQKLLAIQKEDAQRNAQSKVD